MNKRILELSKEAGSVADATYAKGPDAIWLREYNKKFAELIILECINTIQASDESVVCGITVNQVIGDLKEHFGV